MAAVDGGSCVSSACRLIAPATTPTTNLPTRWRELNTVNHWLDVERALRPLTASLALLLHHKSKVVATLLAGLDPAQGPALADRKSVV